LRNAETKIKVSSAELNLNMFDVELKNFPEILSPSRIISVISVPNVKKAPRQFNINVCLDYVLVDRSWIEIYSAVTSITLAPIYKAYEKTVILYKKCP